MKTPPTETVIAAQLRLALRDPPAVLSVSGDLPALLGFTPADLLSGTVALPQRFHPDDADLAGELFAPEGPRVSRVVNIRLRQADGKIRCIRASFTKTIGPDGIELELRLQDAKTLPRTMPDAATSVSFRAMMEATDDHITFKDRNHIFTGASQTLAALCDPAKPWSDLIGQTDYDVFPEHLADSYYRLEKQVFAGLPVAREIQEIRRKDGPTGWVDSRMYPIRADNGAIIGVFGVARDVTALRQAALLHEHAAAEAARCHLALLTATADRDRSQNAARESDARYAAMVQSFPDAIISGDSTGQITGWNPGAERIFGYTQGAMLGQNLRLLVPDRLQARHEAGLARVIAGGPPPPIGGTGELEGRRQDGREFPLHLSSSEWQIGPQKFFTAVIRDSTEHNARKREVARLTRFYRLINEVSHVLVHHKNRTAVFTEICRVLRDCGQFRLVWIGWLDPATRLVAPLAVAGDDHGYVAQLHISASPDVPAGQGPAGRACRLGEVVVCNDFFADPTTWPWREAAARSGVQSCLALPLRQDGQPMGVLTLYATEKDVFGPKEVALLEQSATDISFALDVLAAEERRKQAESKLRKLSTIIEQAPLSIVITDVAGQIEYVNPRFTRVTGYTLEEVRGQNPRLLQSGDTDPETYRAMWDALTRGQVWTGELRNRTKKGERFLECAVIAPVLDERGSTTHFIALKDDITAARRSAADAAAQLDKERLISEMKTRFISVTSHEFRTPMAAALGSIEILTHHLDRLSPEKRAELLARITTSLQRMNEMLDEVLLLNRLGAKRVAVKPAPLAPRSFVAAAIEEIRLGDRDSHRFALHPSGDTAPFRSDPTLLHHILSNLLSNAVRYSPPGSLVTVQLDVAAACLRLTVQDEGIGIPEQDRARLFSPFERGSNVGTINGTGLGLNIVKEMTLLLGGTITLEAATGVGSRFTLRLPSLPDPAP